MEKRKKVELIDETLEPPSTIESSSNTLEGDWTMVSETNSQINLIPEQNTSEISNKELKIDWDINIKDEESQNKNVF